MGVFHFYTFFMYHKREVTCHMMDLTMDSYLKLQLHIGCKCLIVPQIVVVHLVLSFL